ncbi:hypothetical protein SLA2020_070400 [Shorea laevis]
MRMAIANLSSQRRNARPKRNDSVVPLWQQPLPWVCTDLICLLLKMDDLSRYPILQIWPSDGPLVITNTGATLSSFHFSYG